MQDAAATAEKNSTFPLMNQTIYGTDWTITRQGGTRTTLTLEIAELTIWAILLERARPAPITRHTIPAFEQFGGFKMRLSAVVLSLLLTLPQGVKTATPPTPLAIVIKTDKDAIKVGEPLQLTIRLVNLTHSEVKGNFTEMDGMDITDVLRFKDSSGHDLPALKDSSATSFHSYRPRGGGIKAGGKREWQSVIYPSTYVLDKLGNYTFQVVRPDLDNPQRPEIVSNGVTLRIEPAVPPK